MHTYTRTCANTCICLPMFTYKMPTCIRTYIHLHIYTHTPTYVQSNYILSQICYVSKHSFKIQFHTTLVDCNQFEHDDSHENYYALLVSHTEFLQH